MPAILKDISALLTSAGVVTTGWVLKEAWTPDTPDQVVSIAETGPYVYGPDHYGTANATGSIQARVRGNKLDFSTARAKWDAVFNALHGKQFTGGSSSKQYFEMEALNITPLVWYDQNERPNLTLNLWFGYVR